jgi:hypothetical protein
VVVFPKQKLDAAQLLLLGDRNALALAIHLERADIIRRINRAQYALETGDITNYIPKYFKDDPSLYDWTPKILDDLHRGQNALAELEKDKKLLLLAGWLKLINNPWGDWVEAIAKNVLGYPHGDDEAWESWTQQQKDLDAILEQQKEALQKTLREQQRLEWLEIPEPPCTPKPLEYNPQIQITCAPNV